MSKILTAETLRAVLDYDPQSGAFTWLVSRAPKAPAGSAAGSRNKRGYLMIRVFGQRHGGHRLAWLYMTGAWPSALIDHVDGDPGNNKWGNLREATHSQNQFNRRLQKNNATGFKGVRRRKERYTAQIGDKGRGRRQRHIGTFATAEEAHAAWRDAAAERDPLFVRSK